MFTRKARTFPEKGNIIHEERKPQGMTPVSAHIKKGEIIPLDRGKKA